MIAWLLEAATDPATATLPIDRNADVLGNAARRWFRRFRQTDDLWRLVHVATGVSADISRDEFDAVRRLLSDPQTWVKLGKSPLEDLTTRIANFLPPRDGRTACDSQAAALVIVRALLEFATAELEPKSFQQVLLARQKRMERNQASALDKALFDVHSGQPEGDADVISQGVWYPSRQRRQFGVVLVAAAALLLGLALATAGAARSASAAGMRIVKIDGVNVLANGNGYTLYWFAADTATKSACNGLCTAFWPPVNGSLTAGPCGTGELGTIKRSDGSTQATYDGHPLYTYVGDAAPGQANGNPPSTNGGPWHEITYPAKLLRCPATSPRDWGRGGMLAAPLPAPQGAYG